MKTAKSLLSTFVLCLIVVSAATAQAEGDVVVRGTVTNHTPNGALPFGSPVTLQFFDEGDWTSIYTSTLKNDGTFIYSGLSAESGNDFVTRLVYGEAEYFSEPAVLQGEMDVDLFIFEPTDDASQIQVDQAHFFITPAVDLVQVAEYYLLGNSGDRTYIGTMDSSTGKRTTVFFAPPKDAINLLIDGPGLGERFLGEAERFGDTRAIPPGNATIEVSYVYDLVPTDNRVIERVMEIPIASAVFIVSGGELGLQGPGLELSGIMDTQMGPAASYTAGPLAAFDALSFTLVPLMVEESMQPAVDEPTESSVRKRDAGTETGIGVVTLVVAGLVAYRIWQAPARIPMSENAQVIVDQIAALDRKYEQDSMDKVTYQKQRAALKRRIRALLSNQK